MNLGILLRIAAGSQQGLTNYSGYGGMTNNSLLVAKNKIAYINRSGSEVARAMSEAPITANTYFEVEQRSGTNYEFYAYSGVANDGLSLNNTQFIGGTSGSVDFGVAAKQFNGDFLTFINGANTDHTGDDQSLDPVYRFGIAINPTTRKVWVKQVWVGGSSAYVGGGDPVAGTSPTATLSGSGPIYAAGSLSVSSTNGYSSLISNPGQFYGSVPSTYASGLALANPSIVVSGAAGHQNISTSASGSYSSTGGSSSFTYAYDGTLPTGMAISSAGVRSGTLTAAGTFNYVINVIDSNGQRGMLFERIIVGSGAMTLTGTLGNAITNVPYKQVLTIGGAFTKPITAGTSSGTIPSWMTATVDADACTVTYVGTPTTSASAVVFTPQITDSSGTPQTASTASQSVTVSNPAPIAVGASAYLQLNGTTTGVTTQPAGSGFFVVISEGTGPNTPPTDNMGNTYTQIGATINNTAHSMQGSIWYCANGAGGSGHTWTLDSPNPFPCIYAVEVTGALAGGTIDVYGGSTSNTTSTGPWVSGNVTTTNAKDLLLGLLAYDEDASPADATANGSFTLVGSTPTAGPAFGAAISYDSVTSTGVYESSFSCGGGVYGVTFIVAVKSA
jgi:hypothetical protein